MKNGFLKNKIQYLINNDPHCSNVSIVILLKVGSRNEQPKYFGISHLIEHLLFSGTPKRPNPKDIVNSLYRYGAKINAFTDKDSTGYWVKILPRYLDKALDTLSDLLFNSRFTDETIKKEKKIVLNELERFFSEPMKQNYLNVTQLIYHNTSLAHDIGGTENDIKNYTKDMILSYLQKYYTYQNTLIVVNGKIKKNIIEKLEYYFGSKKFNYKPEKYVLSNSINNCFQQLYPNFYCNQNGIRFQNTIRKDLAQTYVSIAVPTFGIKDKRSYVVDIIGNILAGNMGSRLFLILRQKYGLVYNIKKDIDKYEDIGSLKINFSTFNHQESIEQCIKLVLNEFEKMKNILVENKELKYSIDYLTGDLELSVEDSKEMAIFYGYNLIFLDKPYKMKYFIEKYKNVSKKDIQEVAKIIFQKNKLNISILSYKSII